MRILTKSIMGTHVEGADGYVGAVKDVFFSSDTWRVQYLVIDTGKWLPGRRVVLSPHAFERTDWPNHSMFVRQTRQQIEDSPSVLEHEPVSRQKEIELAEYFQWPTYWGEIGRMSLTPTYGVPPAVPSPVPHEETTRETKEKEPESPTEPDLRSAKEVIGYHVEATDGDVGHVQDFVVDDEAWAIRYLVVNTQRWLPLTSVLVSPAWAEEVSWDRKRVVINIPAEKVKGSPEFHPREPVNRRYEEKLYDYYGRPVYWR